MPTRESDNHGSALRVASLLDEADRLRRFGMHAEALQRLDELQRLATSRHDSIWQARGLIERARNLVKLGDDPGAWIAVSGVPHEVLAMHPGIACSAAIIRGILNRRSAHEAWKRGDDASSMLAAAFASLREAVAAAQIDLDQRKLCDAKVNFIWVQGLEAAVKGESEISNPGLIQALLPIQRAARAFTAPVDRDDAADLTIVADLAAGCGMEVADVFNIRGGADFSVACLDLLQTRSRTWTELLLGLTRTGRSPKASLARALILGSRFLVAEFSPGKVQCAYSYQVALLSLHLDFQLGNPRLAADVGAAMSRVAAISGIAPPTKRIFG